jgi:hypothetical protein
MFFAFCFNTEDVKKSLEKIQDEMKRFASVSQTRLKTFLTDFRFRSMNVATTANEDRDIVTLLIIKRSS